MILSGSDGLIKHIVPKFFKHTFCNVICIALVLLFVAIFPEEFETDILCDETLLLEQVTIGDYVLRSLSTGCPGYYSYNFEIFYKGKFVHTSTNDYGQYVLSHQDYSINDHLIQPGKDINGNGIPDVVISFTTGGAHCCYFFEVWELGDTLKLLGEFDVKHAYSSHFEANGSEKSLIFHTVDHTFAYWNATYGPSPQPEVKLRYCNGKYRLAADLMRKPPISSDKLEKIITDRRSDDLLHLEEPILWRTMLDLIYSGNEKQAYQFLEKAWVTSTSDKRKFIKEFKKQLETSPYWREIKVMNRTKNYKCEDVEPNHERPLTYVVHGDGYIK